MDLNVCKAPQTELLLIYYTMDSCSYIFHTILFHCSLIVLYLNNKFYTVRFFSCRDKLTEIIRVNVNILRILFVFVLKTSERECVLRKLDYVIKEKVK